LPKILSAFLNDQWFQGITQFGMAAISAIPDCIGVEILVDFYHFRLEEGMYLGRVMGRVVCTQKDPQMHGLKMLIVTAIDDDGAAIGQPFVACDSTDAGNGGTVFLCGGSEASLPFVKQRPPSDATILGIVDLIEK